MAVGSGEKGRKRGSGRLGTPSSPVKAIIFDIDGVLADSRGAVAHNTKTLMREYGFSVPGKRVDEMSTAHSADSVLLSLAPELSEDPMKLKEMLARLSVLTAENMQMVRPTPLAAKIPALAKKYRLAAATNRKRSAVLVLEKFGMGKYFSVVVTSADAPPKPNPRMVAIALEKMGAKAGEAVFVGDNQEDRIAGEAAGVRTIMIDAVKDRRACKKFLKEFL